MAFQLLAALGALRGLGSSAHGLVVADGLGLGIELEGPLSQIIPRRIRAVGREQLRVCGREYEEPAADGPLFHWGKYQALSTRGTSRRIPTWTSSPKPPGGGNLSAVVGEGVASRLG